MKKFLGIVVLGLLFGISANAQPIGTDFYISPGELNFSKENEKNFYIYRVYEFLPEKMIGKIYMKKGSVEENFNLTPLQYKVSL